MCGLSFIVWSVKYIWIFPSGWCCDTCWYINLRPIFHKWGLRERTQWLAIWYIVSSRSPLALISQRSGSATIYMCMTASMWSIQQLHQVSEYFFAGEHPWLMFQQFLQMLSSEEGLQLTLFLFNHLSRYSHIIAYRVFLCSLSSVSTDFSTLSSGEDFLAVDMLGVSSSCADLSEWKLLLVGLLVVSYLSFACSAE